MIRNALCALLLIVVAQGAASGQEWARKMFRTTSHSFGSVARGAKAEFAFEFTNLYEEPVHVASVRSSCGCTTVSVAKNTLATWEKGAIVAKFNTLSFLGDKHATITVVFDKPYYAELQLDVTGFIRSDVVFTPGAVEFGEVEEGVGGVRKISLAYAGRDDWKVVDVRSANTNLEVELLETQRGGGRVGYEMQVRLKPEAPAGFLLDQLTLVTNDRRLTEVPLMVEGKVAAALQVSPASLFLGVLEPGQTVTKQLVVRGKQPFHITGVKCGNSSFTFKTPDDAKNLHLVPVTFTADQAGKIVERIEIQTDLGSGASAHCVATATVGESAAE